MAIWGPTSIASDADDGFYNGTVWNSRTAEGEATGEFFVVKRDGAVYEAGALRFLNVTIPAGATINSATLELSMVAAGSIDDAQSIIRVVADVGASRSAALDATHHPELDWTDSTAQVDVINLAIVTGREVTITSVIDEVMGLGGWASGDNICLALRPAGSDIYWAVDIVDYDADTLANVAKLTIDYTAAGGPTHPFTSISIGI